MAQSPQRATPRFGRRDRNRSILQQGHRSSRNNFGRRQEWTDRRGIRAEAEIDLLRIRRLRASQLNAVQGNPAATGKDYSELNESLAKLERYERRALSRRKRALLAMIEN